MRQPLWRASLVLASLVLGAAQAQGTPPTPVLGAALFERLTPAERQLLLAVVGVSGSDQFQPGQVLPGLPFPAPTLPGQQVVGSVSQTGGSRVIVRTTLAPTAAQQTAEKALRAAGWQNLYPDAGMTGLVFESSRRGEYVSPLCKPGVPGTLTVYAFGGETGGAQVSYGYSLTGFSQSCPANMPQDDPAQLNFYAPYRNQTVYRPADRLEKRGLKLPQLPAPDGAQVESTNLTSGDTEVSAYTSIYGSQDTEALRRHYAAALQAQGWQLVDTRTFAGQSVTRFTFRAGKEEGVGTLSLKARTDLKDTTRPPRHDVQLELQLP
ncbi:hypothetical protein [Deinococcus wulumuqiensis]|uniref:PASTA domain-containing protein n=1 Tax=Deinococcus wulumuqiensis TaxID=980427 RepID=A0AAV4K3U1_9DEIO|nr:hypothetical protein [Deinococcus wulumuqiensis]QII21356.1 hypothetical protein G6R31_11875 [Deinococcus wulumuqiensis R12]GGI78372.1 hypothetical protein GCM10010914_10740 [Deinococcus wulumuqiensis]GGP30564.1 hypothetical protein GCM10008021_22150 [Deinococcus wulumuqiensis]